MHMANVIGRTQGFSKKGAKAGEATRLGSESVRAQANTWRTFASIVTDKDGSVRIEVRRDDRAILTVAIDAETNEDSCVKVWDGNGGEPLVALAPGRASLDHRPRFL